MDSKLNLPAPIPGVENIENLQALALAGVFASVEHELPCNWQDMDFKVSFWDKVLNFPKIKAIYAPGDQSGWAEVYLPSSATAGFHTGATAIVYGKWMLLRE